MASRSLVPFLVAMMLLTGVCNTVLTKYQDMQCVRSCDDPARKAYFHQPVLQTAQMFVGEMGCWLVVGAMALWRKLSSNHSPESNGYEAIHGTDADGDVADTSTSLIETNDGGSKPSNSDTPAMKGRLIILLALPAICDICGTTLMNIGLLLVAASIYQMTRGALVLFVGLFSVLFLRRRLFLFQWLSLAGVVLGVGVVGLSGALFPEDKSKTGSQLIAASPHASSALLSVAGVLLIAGAQIFTATQFVLEEYMLERWAIDPIQVVGWEGVFGFVVTVAAMVILHLSVGQTDAGRYGYFDMVEGWRQMTTNKNIGLTSFLIMISIGGFNFFGLSVTRSVSATSRSTIDTCRTLFIWIVSLGLRWETFKWLQVVGFAMLVYSTFLFNGIVQPPFKILQIEQEVDELLPEEPIEHH